MLEVKAKSKTYYIPIDSIIYWDEHGVIFLKDNKMIITDVLGVNIKEMYLKEKNNGKTNAAP